ncbi:twin-arginine translocation pathway signal [Paracoccus aurantiacus]|uniref:Twin-arginine translocation pathway signal n=1 Tax=Paracoccus aurantiacus TaxID=2599412 RepID=A0A5C6S881_9RHOB|nr:YSC84-related protein [Paracoccus aurantiacus]TXB70600.1 twin-arginine translocation pathway signal [Paracoccus aurantiacus]
MGHHKVLTRRGFVAGAAVLTLAACNNGLATNATATLEGRVNATLNELFAKYPNARALVDNAKGVLVMPVMTQAGLGVGGSYGEGALRVGGKTVDYYSAAQASIGFQAGARQFAHVLVFQTDQALAGFRAAPGWVAGAGAFYALPEEGMTFGTDTVTRGHPVVAMIFGQTGIMAGAAIEGTKYTRIIPSAIAAR